MVSIQNLTARSVLADRAQTATGLFQRMIGLLSRSSLEEGDALIFPRCNAIHTYGMRFSIDVLFLRTVQGSRFKVQGHNLQPRTLNLEPILGTVVRTAERVRPRRLLSARGADMVIELPGGSVTRTGTQPGHHMALSYAASEVDG